MKQFFYKTLIAVVAVILVYEFTIAKQIKKFSSQGDILLSKEGRKEGVEKIREEIKKSFPNRSEIEKDFIIDIEAVENLDPLITNTDGTISKYGIEIIIYFKVKATNTNDFLINDVVRGFAQYTVETSEIESDDKKKRMIQTATNNAIQMMTSKIQSDTSITNDN